MEKKRGEKGSNVCFMEDRASQLPDEIICDILSRLDYTVDTVRTSVLSKRWRLLWTSVPVIVLQGNMTKTRYMDFVDKVLSLNQVSCLQKFKLTCYCCCCDCDLSRFRKWISDVSMHSIEILELSYNSDEFFDNDFYNDDLAKAELPHSIYTHKNLQQLTLKGEFVLNALCVVYLPNLKTLHLVLKDLDDGDSLKKLIDGCPVLEELEILEVHYCEVLHIKSDSLKRLKVISTTDYTHIGSCIIHAIKLEEIELFQYSIPLEFKGSNFASLVTADLDFCNASEPYVLHYWETTVEILRAMSNTVRLTLANYDKTVFGYTGPQNFPQFRRLTHLTLLTDDCCVSMWPSLLECSPNLISVYFRLDEVSDGNKERCNQSFCTPKRSMLKLEKIKIYGARGCDHEMEMVDYFVMNSPVLKKIDVEGNVRDQISKIAKCSTDNYTMFLRLN